MNTFLEKIALLEEKHDRLDPELVKKSNVKLGLRNLDGTGVVVGITSKGQVRGYEKDRWGHNIAVPGKLYYCGYDVEEIVNNIEKEKRFGFEEITYLLLTSELPEKDDLKHFTKELARRRSLPNDAKEIIQYNSKNDDQMGALHIAISALHKFDENPRSLDIKDVTRQCLNLIAKFPTIIAYNYHVLRSNGGTVPSFIEPDVNLSTAENFFYLLNGEKAKSEISHAFDIALILHAEHGGGNNSTFTVRTVSSSLTDTYMAICAGVASLAGHLHGGANESVMNMMDDIKENVRDWNDEKEIYSYLEKVVDKRAGDLSGKIYGIGHAVYTVSDPREPILRSKAITFAEQAGRMEELKLYDKIAEISVKLIKKKKGKKVCPNVDFYSGFVYDMMGISRELFTPIFAMARVVGWSAHRIEEIIQGRLIRPAYVSSLKGFKKYTPISKR